MLRLWQWIWQRTSSKWRRPIAQHRIIDRKRLTRRQFEAFIDGLSAGTRVVMEACGTAHYWGRRCQARGLVVRLLPVQYVRPYVRRNKTDRTDTEAMLEANRCAELHPVPVKTIEQQGLQALHRVRTQWQATRTARINMMRGFLREHGCPVPVGARTVLARVTAILDAPAGRLPTMLQQTVRHLVEEVRSLETRVAEIERELARVARELPEAARLQQIPGVGIVTATAMLGAVGHIRAFRRGRDFASWLGLTPRESTTGTRRYLGRISKRGDGYLRCLLTHGARAVLLAAQRTARLTPHWPNRDATSPRTIAEERGYDESVALMNRRAFVG